MQAVILDNRLLDKQQTYQKATTSSKQSDNALFQKVLDYFQTHLEEPLTSSKAMSKMFGTNEFYLKDSYRKMLKTSIYQFYNDERLKKAQLLIEKPKLH